MPTREQIIAAARGWIDTPFLHQGRVKGRGLDCVGLPLMVAGEFGLVDINGNPLNGDCYKEYDPQPLGTYVQDICHQHLVSKSMRLMLPGDVVTLRVETAPCHVAIVGERNNRITLIHAYATANKVLEQELDARWRRRLSNCFAFPGVED